MREMLRVSLRALRNNLVLIVAFAVLVTGVVISRVARTDIYASENLASISVASGLSSNGEFDVLNQETYLFNGTESNSQNLASEIQYFDGSSSICYVYTVENISSHDIHASIIYDPNNSVNFTAIYSVNDGDYSDLSTAIIVVPESEVITIRVLVSIADLSLDAMLDGALELVISA